MPLKVMQPATLEPYLSGEKLLGDDATPEQLQAWLAAEANAYAELESVADTTSHYAERSRALNLRHFGQAFIGKSNLTGLVIGPADATELKPLAPHMAKWEVIEPAQVYQKQEYYTCPATFLPVHPQGKIALPEASVDVVLVLSVLHHIANVSFVLAEIARVLKPGGMLILREPTVTMGDWTQPRPGLTPNERGLPLNWLLPCLSKVGLHVTQAKPAVFPPFDTLMRRMGMQLPYANRAYVTIDGLLSQTFASLAKYHRPRWYHKFAPAAVLLIARKEHLHTV